MKKVFLLLAIGLVFSVSGYAQKPSADSKFQQAADELKTALVTKLSLSQEAAGKIAVIENDFNQRLSAIEAMGNVPAKDKEAKLNEARKSSSKVSYK